MNCEQAAEFVSALFDGERIPREAAEHIGSCVECGALMHEYAAIGAELRRKASAAPSMEAGVGKWSDEEIVPRKRLQNWRASMRIPRFAFALMVMAILLLCGSLIVVRARPGISGAALLLSVKLPPQYNHTHWCAIPVEGKRSGEPCAFTSTSPHVPGLLYVGFHYVARNEERIELAAKIKYIARPDATKENTIEELNSVPEELIWIAPGEVTKLPISSLGSIELAGQSLDHMPLLPSMPMEALDPQGDEFRIVSPVLIRDNEVVFNMSGSSAIATGNEPAVMLYAPGVGRYVLSAQPFAGAIEAKVKLGQIEFNEDGHRFLLVNSMPVARSERVWILHEPNFRPSAGSRGVVSDENWLSTSGKLSMLLNWGKGPSK